MSASCQVKRMEQKQTLKQPEPRGLYFAIYLCRWHAVMMRELFLKLLVKTWKSLGIETTQLGRHLYYSVPTFVNQYATEPAGPKPYSGGQHEMDHETDVINAHNFPWFMQNLTEKTFSKS